MKSGHGSGAASGRRRSKVAPNSYPNSRSRRTNHRTLLHYRAAFIKCLTGVSLCTVTKTVRTLCCVCLRKVGKMRRSYCIFTSLETLSYLYNQGISTVPRNAQFAYQFCCIELVTSCSIFFLKYKYLYSMIKIRSWFITYYKLRMFHR